MNIMKKSLTKEQRELDELYKDSPDDYKYSWQYLNNK